MIYNLTTNSFMENHRIKTEPYLDGLVRWMTVYTVAAVGIFFVVKDYLIGDVIVCQPINRGVKANLSYSQSEADYDKAYCSLSMTDITDNLILATAEQPNVIPGVSVIGIKGEGRVIYQKLFPFILLIQAAFCCIPTLLWQTWAAEMIRACVKYIVDYSKTVPSGGSSFGTSSPQKNPSQDALLEDLNNQVHLWESERFFASVYTTKVMLTLGILLFIVCFYLVYPVLNYFSFQELFVCHVHKQTLVTCAFPDIDLIRLAWIVNIVLVDLSVIIVVFQLLNVAFCLPRKRTFFARYLNIEERKASSCKLVDDADLISYFCYENVSHMSSKIVQYSPHRKNALYSPLISLGNSEEDLNSTNSTVSYSTAPQIFRRATEDKGKE